MLQVIQSLKQEKIEKYKEEYSLSPEKYYPTVIIESNKTLTFGNHKITVLKGEDHSNCSVLLNINDKYLHVADNILKHLSKYIRVHPS